MSSTGYIQVRAYASNALLPLKDVAVAVTDTDGNAVAMRLTNRSGSLSEPIQIEVPDLYAGQTPDSGTIPFTSVNLYARLEDYELINIKSVQVFPDTVTLQNLEMIPLSELPDDPNKSESFTILPQNL